MADIGFVGGSDEKKIREQLDEDTIQLGNYFFSENGLMAYRGSELVGREVAVGAFRPSRTSWEKNGSRPSSTSACDTSLTSTFPSKEALSCSIALASSMSLLLAATVPSRSGTNSKSTTTSTAFDKLSSTHSNNSSLTTDSNTR